MAPVNILSGPVLSNKMLSSRCHLVILYIFMNLVFCDSSFPSVHFPLGSIRGRYESAEGSKTSVQAFLNIPYAQPPVGQLRFTKPRLFDQPWIEERDGTEYGPFCPQNPLVMEGKGYEPCCLPVKTMSEDCLQLNIFTPNTDARHPVIVFIHGGGYMYGSGILYDGTAIAAHHDIVVVTINYRLAPFNYIHDSSQDKGPSATGHLGHLDQRTALQWVQKYISYFGGDSKRVTLAGQSAGAASVTFHLLSEASVGLFSQAIIHSDYTLVSSYPQNGDRAINEITSFLDCKTDAVQCLKQKTVEELIDAVYADSIGEDRGLTRWRGIFDGVNIADDPIQQLKTRNFSQIPVMIGVTANEGYHLSKIFLPNTSPLTYRQDFIPATQNFIRDVFGDDSPRQEEMLSSVLDFNFGKNPKFLDDEKFLLRRWSELIGDMYLRAPTTRLAQLIRGSRQPIYFYEFTHRAGYMKESRPSWHFGCDHTAELQFFWGFPFLNSHSKCNATYTQTEIKFAHDSLAYYANFIKSGNPNGDNLFQWPEFDQQEAYIILEPRTLSAKGYKHDRVNYYMDKLLRIRLMDSQHQSHDEL